jgi:hypothetical protein
MKCVSDNPRHLTKRAPDVWDSAAFSSIFHASSFSCSQALSTPAHTQVTQAVRHSLIFLRKDVMYAQITIIPNKTLPDNDILRSKFADYFRNKNPNLLKAINSTTKFTEKDYDWLNELTLHSYASDKKVFLIYYDQNSLFVHVELPDRRNKIPPLKKELEILVKGIIKVINSLDVKNKISATACDGEISAEGNSFQGVSMAGFKDRAIQTIKDNIESKFYLPIATLALVAFFTKYFPQGELQKALQSAATTIVLFLLWIIIDAAFFRSKFVYTEYKE